MSITLDGKAVFDRQEVSLSVGSPNRASVERAVAGLDGMLSIDIGLRSRQIRQTGLLRAPSRAAMTGRLQAIEAFLDGRTHTLVAPDGQVYDNLRMDAFRKACESVAGPGVTVEYEIVYTQLGG